MGGGAGRGRAAPALPGRVRQRRTPPVPLARPAVGGGCRQVKMFGVHLRPSPAFGRLSHRE